MSNNSTIRFDLGMAIHIQRTATGKVYLKFRLSHTGQPTWAAAFTRGTYDEKFNQWCEISKQQLGLARRYPRWKKIKPKFDDIIKQFDLTEEVFYRYS